MKNPIELLIGCAFCGKSHSVVVEEEDYWDWDDGKLAQHAFPYLNATEKEQLISHICPKCQEDIFGQQELGSLLWAARCCTRRAVFQIFR